MSSLMPTVFTTARSAVTGVRVDAGPGVDSRRDQGIDGEGIDVEAPTGLRPILLRIQMPPPLTLLKMPWPKVPA